MGCGVRVGWAPIRQAKKLRRLILSNIKHQVGTSWEAIDNIDSTKQHLLKVFLCSLLADSMESLLLELQFEKAKSIALQVSHNEEKALRIKAEASLQELRRVHETLACDCEMSEEFIVNKVIALEESRQSSPHQITSQMTIDLTTFYHYTSADREDSESSYWERAVSKWFRKRRRGINK